MTAPHKSSAVLATLLLTLLTAASATAEPIGWIERFALADDREALLSELIPGTDDYYFYRCLHYQTIGELDRAEAALGDWLKEKKGRQTALIQAMMDRQRLLTYDATPQRTIDYLVARLGVQLQHAPPPTQGERRYPSSLQAEILADAQIVRDALRQNNELTPAGLRFLTQRFLSGETAGLPINLRDLLQRIDGAYAEGLDDLVIQELSRRRAGERRFGDLSAHNYLTLSELRRVADAVPDVADDDQFVRAMLARIRPGADADASQQPQVRLDYLRRVDNYVRELPNSYNGLKASAAYRLLEENLNHGIFDRQLFLRYLQLPRTSPIVIDSIARRPVPRANLNEDFMDLALLPPIGDERPVVRTHLEHFLRDAEGTGEFAGLLRPDYLNRVFAETKLLTGAGDADRWYRMLNPSQRKEIRDATEIRFAPENPERFSDRDQVKLLVDLKNIEELVVRVYEINTQAYYRTHQQPIDTDLDLDGLAATAERRLRYSLPSVIRHREVLELPSVEGRGVWIVDLVGDGVRARALIRRGSLHHVESITANGLSLTVIDEHREPVSGASIIVDSREFVADEDGRVQLPPLVDAVRRRVIIRDDWLAESVELQHPGEDYKFEAGFYIDQTLLQNGRTTKLLVRPQLTLQNTPIDPGAIKDVEVTIRAVDTDDISSVKTLDDLQINQNGELVVPFRVPRRLAKLNVTVSGVVDRLSDGQTQPVSTSRSWDVAEIQRTILTRDAFLTRDSDNFVIEVRGRNGETVPAATVTISLTSGLRQLPIEKTLQTDERGRINLGTLPGINEIRFGVADGMQHQRNLRLNDASWPARLHTTTNQLIRLPLKYPVERIADHYRLLEIRDGSIARDHTQRLSAKQGMLVITQLPAGNFNLVDRHTGQTVPIAAVDGPMIQSVAVGQVRQRALSRARDLGVASITRGDDGLTIQLEGDTGLARVHLFVKRYLGPSLPANRLKLPPLPLPGRSISMPRCGYVGDLRLGEEYQYVLRRRYAAKFPGVMLPQPSLLLNPWETKETSNADRRASAGQAPPALARRGQEDRQAGKAQDLTESDDAGTSSYKFLADAGTQVLNLRPDENGLVTVPKEVIAGMPLVQIVVADPLTLIQRTIAGRLDQTETQDLRLTASLEADRALTFERAVTIASAQRPLDLGSLASAQMQIYPSVGKLLTHYRTLVNDSRLDDFARLARWNELDLGSKLAAYTELACHELHVFLWAHDRPFFDEVVRPYLENKKEKQFVDHWLLQEDLGVYTELWRYNTLNAAEKALLAIRAPRLRDAVLREMREVVAGQEDDHLRRRTLLETALKRERLSEDAPSRLWDADFAEDAGRRSSDKSRFFNFGQAGQNNGRGQTALGLAERKEVAEALQREMGDQDQDRLSAGVAMFERRLGRAATEGFFRKLDSTKQWAESHWDRVRAVRDPSQSLVPIDRFWLAVANHSDAQNLEPSEHLLEPVANRHAALMGLALCGLPLEAGDVELPEDLDDDFSPEHPVAVVMKRLRQLEELDEEARLLVGQQFSRADPTGPQSDEESREPEEFLTGVAYRGRTVISNPTSESLWVDVFWQIPAGSIPLSGNHATDSKRIKLEPFAVQSLPYDFYFPQAGEYAHYPATVASELSLLGRGSRKTFVVREEPSAMDETSWPAIARRGSADQIRSFLANANLRELDWSPVYHRLRDVDVFDAVSSILNDEKLLVPVIWGYGFHHRDVTAMSVYLNTRRELVERVGPVLRSTLLVVEPIERQLFEHLEYAPLVRPRQHRLGDKNEIFNPAFLTHYQQFVRMLAFESDISDEQRLALSYYLLLQNRIEEAIARFKPVERSATTMRLQYDYLDGYLAMHRADYGHARSIANRHQSHPVPRWRERFGVMADHLRQQSELLKVEQLVSNEDANAEQAIPQGSADLAVIDRQRRQERASEQQPEVIVEVEGDHLRIDHRRAAEVTIRFYGVDLELLFSKAPFVREDLQRMAVVKPMRSEQIRFDEQTGVGRLDLDANLRRQTLLVEAVAGGSRSTALYYGGELTTFVSQSYGQLQTTDPRHRPVRAAYVKVYARYPDGSVRFFKDGYTDARGRFDYATVSAGEAQGAVRFAILVLDEERGATLHEVAAPNS